MKLRLKAFKRRLLYNIKRPEMRILPGQLAFFFILTLVPLIAFAGLIPIAIGVDTPLVDFLFEGKLPNEVVKLLKSIVVSSNIGPEGFFFLLSALLLASKGTRSMIIASNQIYKIKNSSYLRSTIKAIMMLIVLVFLIVFIILVPVFGNHIVDFIIDLGFAKKSFFITLYHNLSLPMSFFVMFFTIKLLYTMAPDMKLPSRETNYGALFTAATWLIFTQAYSYYLKYFPIRTNFYGNLSSLLVLMWWLYFLAYLFVLGMALNASKYAIDESIDKK